MFLTYKPEDYQKEAERINERAAKQFPWVKDFKLPADELKFAKEQSREFFLDQGGNPDRHTQIRDVEVTLHPRNAGGYFVVKMSIDGPFNVGGFKLEAVPQHERIEQRKQLANTGDCPWMTVDVGEGLRRHHEIRKSECNPTSTWSKADWQMEKSRLFDEAKEKAAEKPAARAYPSPPAFMLRDNQRPAVQR